MKIRVKYKRKNIFIDVKKTGYFSKYFGLMFRTSKTQNLLFDFKKKVSVPFTSFFVFFSFIMLYLDDKNRVIDIRKAYPFEFIISPREEYVKVVELPINSKNSKIIAFFVGKSRKI